MNKAKFNYQILNPTKTRSLIFLHGFMGSLNDWEGIAPYLPEYKLILIDLPGHGESKLLGPNTTFEDLLEELHTFIQKLQLQAPSLVGYSMGGRIALSLACKFATLFSSLIIESANPGLKTKTERSYRLKHDLAISRKLLGDSLSFKAFLTEWYSAPLWGNIAKNLNFKKLLITKTKQDPKLLAAAISKYSVASQPNLWDELEKLKIPVLAIAGELDAKYSTIVKEMSEMSNNVQSVIIPNTGHNVHFGQPELYIEHLLTFL